MPFTPLHLGPGLAFKALGGKRFSFLVFGGAQVMMDIEPLLGLLNDWPVLHGPTHTLAGALAIGLLATALGHPVSRAFLRLLSRPFHDLTWGAACAGAFAGTLSHILFDAVMHSDMHPSWPVAAGNPLLGAIGLGHLHLLCLALGLLGLAILGIRQSLSPKKIKHWEKP